MNALGGWVGGRKDAPFDLVGGLDCFEEPGPDGEKGHLSGGVGGWLGGRTVDDASFSAGHGLPALGDFVEGVACLGRESGWVGGWVGGLGRGGKAVLY